MKMGILSTELFHTRIFICCSLKQMKPESWWCLWQLLLQQLSGFNAFPPGIICTGSCCCVGLFSVIFIECAVFYMEMFQPLLKFQLHLRWFLTFPSQHPHLHSLQSPWALRLVSTDSVLRQRCWRDRCLRKAIRVGTSQDCTTILVQSLGRAEAGSVPSSGVLTQSTTACGRGVGALRSLSPFQPWPPISFHSSVFSCAVSRCNPPNSLSWKTPMLNRHKLQITLVSVSLSKNE